MTRDSKTNCDFQLHYIYLRDAETQTILKFLSVLCLFVCLFGCPGKFNEMNGRDDFYRTFRNFRCMLVNTPDSYTTSIK